MIAELDASLYSAAAVEDMARAFPESLSGLSVRGHDGSIEVSWPDDLLLEQHRDVLHALTRLTEVALEGWLESNAQADL